jgi:glucose-1-phosphate thymidylyltransferase
MKQKGIKFIPGKVDEWLDCGNKDATVYTNKRILELNKKAEKLISATIKSQNSMIIEPCYIGNNVELTNSVIGPYVSVGDNSRISHSVIENSIIQTNSKIIHANIENSMVGNFVEYSGEQKEISIGDYSTQV